MVFSVPAIQTQVGPNGGFSEIYALKIRLFVLVLLLFASWCPMLGSSSAILMKPRDHDARRCLGYSTVERW